MRTFISLNPDENTKDEIFKIQKDLIRCISDLNGKLHNHIKWESKDKFHLTLFFIGETNESQLSKTDGRLSGILTDNFADGITFGYGGINAFPKMRYPRVIILELVNEDKRAFDLYRNINSALKSLEIHCDKKFHPHITLGRVKRDHKINLSELNFSTDHNLNFTLSDFCLMESKLKSSGSEYSLIKKYNL